jgi:hypothetical protein
MKLTAVALASALATTLWAVPARATDCEKENSADKIFAHPYGEPPAPCKVEPGLDKEPDTNPLTDDRGPRKLRTLGLSGMEGGATVAGLGGVMLILSIFLDSNTKVYKAFYWGGIGVASLGGAIFLTGGTLLIIDAVSAGPTPDKKGAQITVAFRF